MNDMNWLAIYPEILLLVMGCVVALADLWVTDEQRRPTYWLTQLTLVVVGGMHFAYFDAGVTTYAMQNMVVADPMGHLLAGFACLATLITLVYARPYAASRDMLKGELFILSLFSLLGINVMLSANNFLVGFLLYGLSMMYGATGSLTIPEVFDVISKGIPNKSVLVFGTVFVVAGLAFKLGAAPFHMWVPDVYQGAPTAVTLLIGGAPKLAAFAITVRLLVEGMIGLAVDWQQMLVVLSVMSLLIGNLAAIAQSNLKRMLAYSTIANMGFMLLGMTSGVVNDNTLSASNAYSAAMFYAVTYVLTTLGTFGMIILLSRQGHEAEEIKDLAGLAKRSPWFALVMAIFMFSLAGLPPTVGFYAKLAVLQALVSTGLPFYLWLAGFAVVVSLIGAFYYLRVVKVMFFDAPTDMAPLAAPGDVRFVMTLNGAAVLVFGLLPSGLLELCKVAIRQALAT